MSRSRLAIGVVVAMVVLAAWPGLAMGGVRGEPNLEATLADGTVAPGEETALTLVLANDATLSQVSLTNPTLAERVTTASGVSITVESGTAPLSIERGGDQLLGSITDGGRVTTDVGVTVDEDASPGTYHLDVTAEYSYASYISDRIGAVNQRTVEETFEVAVVVERDDVRFRVVDTQTTVRTGESGTFAATVEHTGRQTARDVRLQLRSLDGAVSPTETGQASRYLGNWQAGEQRTVSYRVTARPDATDTNHALELVPTYENAHGDTTTGRPLAVGLSPATGERFRIQGITGTDSGDRPQLGVGGRTAVTVDLTNRGPGAAENVSVQLATTSPATTVDGGSAAVRSVGRVRAGGDRTVTFDVGVASTAQGGNYTFGTTVTYDDTTGATVTSRAWPVAIRVQPAPTVTLGALDSTLYVGERGTLSGTIRNTGPTTARNAVLRVTDAPLGVRFTETAYPVGDLAGGEQTSFSLPARVPAGTTAGPRAVTYVLAYETVDGTVVSSDPLRASVPVQPERDTFDLAVQNGTFAPDSTEELVFEVTNTDETPRTDVQITLAPAPPFTSVAPSVYVGQLDPGETTTVRFPIETDEDAIEASHAIAVNVSGEDGAGLTEHERHRVTVTVATDNQPVDTMPLVVLGGLSVVLVAALGWWWFTRR